MNKRRKETLNLAIATSRSVFEHRTFGIRRRSVTLDRDVLSVKWLFPLIFFYHELVYISHSYYSINRNYDYDYHDRTDLKSRVDSDPLK